VYIDLITITIAIAIAIVIVIPTALATVYNFYPETSSARASPRGSFPKSVIEVEMPDLEPESESKPKPEPEPPIVSKALVCSRKRARPSSTIIDLDSDFPNLYSFTLVKQYQSKVK